MSLEFSVLDTECKVINMHLKQQSLQMRLRDFGNILAAHEESINEDTIIFFAGGFNFNLDVSKTIASARSWRDFDEWNILKRTKKYPEPRDYIN